MGDPFKKVQPGDRLEIPAAAYNAFIDAALAHRASAREGPPALRTRRTVLVRNNTGSNLGRFWAVRLGVPLIDPSLNENAFLERIAFQAEQPAAGQVGRFGILQVPLAPGAVGPAVIEGITPAIVVTDDPGHRFAEIDPNLTQGELHSNTHGSAEILWHSGQTGWQWAVVRLGPARGVRHAKVQDGWQNLSADQRRSVIVKACDADGQNETGPTFQVQTALRPGFDTYLFSGDVVDWEETEAGDRVIVSPHLNDRARFGNSLAARTTAFADWNRSVVSHNRAR